MILLFDDVFEKSSNITTNICKFVEQKKIPFKIIHYMSICDNYLYGRIFTAGGLQPDHERTIRFNISNPLNPELDKSFNIRGFVSSHNMYFFKDKNNITRSLGGQHRGNNSRDAFNLNKEFNIYHSKNKMIRNPNIMRSTIVKSYFTLIYDYTKECPYYANGLHLFNLEKNTLICQNNKLPVISGLHEGRYDGFYGDFDPEYKNISKCKGGLSVFDSISSVVYDYINDLYILYQRSNISRGRRTIQYTTSKDLIKWSPFNLINLGSRYNHLDNNIYYSNFFKIDKSRFTVGILPFINLFGKNPFNGVSQIINPDNKIINHVNAPDPKENRANVQRISPNTHNLLLLKVHANNRKISINKIANNKTNITKLGKKTILQKEKLPPAKNNKLAKNVHQKNMNFTNNFSLVYSFDSINYKYIGDFLSFPSSGHPYSISTNHPYVFNDKLYFYFHYNEHIIIYTLEKNRYTCVSNSIVNKESSFTTKKIKFENNKININYAINNNGYIKIQLLNETNVVIPGFSFADFDEIKSNNSLEYLLTWNNISQIPINIVKIEVQFLNAFIYSFDGCLE